MAEGEEAQDPGLGVALSVVDIDGDGRSDVVAFTRGGETDQRTIQFLVTR